MHTKQKLTMIFAMFVAIFLIVEGVEAQVTESFSDRASFDAAISEHKIVETAFMRAGDGANSGIELYLGGDEDDDFSWDFDGSNAISLTYDDAANYNLSVVPVFGTSGSVTAPRGTDWFDSMFISVNRVGGFFFNFNLSDVTINGTSVGDMSTPAGTFNGMWFDLDGYTEYNQPEFNLTASLDMFGSGDDDDFRVTVYFVQMVPKFESIQATLALSMMSGTANISTTNLSDSASVTNILQMKADLPFGSWSNLYSVTGVTETNWTIPVTTNQSFYRIKTVW